MHLTTGMTAWNEEQGTWRLSPAHVQDLRDVATGVEETNAGICCRYLVDQMAGSGGASDIDPDGYIHRLADLEKFVERYGDWGKHRYVREWRARIARCRRALKRLRQAGDHRSADILLVAYGHPSPCANELVGPLGRELAQLARYTDVVEHRRRELIWAEVSERSKGDIVILAEHRWRMAWVDRAVSSGDALRAALAPFHEPPSPAREARREAHKARLEAFRLDVKIEARRMLLAAEKAYHAAWLASASPG